MTMQRLDSILVGMGLSERTISAYKRVYTQLAGFVNGKPTQTDLLSFLGRVRSSGISESSYYLYYYALKKLAEIIKVPLNVKPPVRPEPQSRPVITLEQLEDLVFWAKKNGTKATKFYLALSCAFGFRRTELCSLSPENFVDNYIIVRPKKRGRTRRHVIPEEIAEEVYSFRPSPMNEGTMSEFFKGLARKVGVKLPPRSGWHSIRRLLVTSLYTSGVDPLLINKFMGWSLSSATFAPQMVDVYARIESEEIDRTIFENNKLLDLWREDE